MADKKVGGAAVIEGPVGQLLKDRSGREIELVGQTPEGQLFTNPTVGALDLTPTQLCTVVESRLFLGYGGPLAIENQHGLQKALHEDGIYTLSNGQRYVVPHEIHEALGIPLPAPYPPELLLLNDEVAPGDENLTGEALDAAKARHALARGRGPDVETKPAPKPTPTQLPADTHKK
jgi:hypothetical protein